MTTKVEEVKLIVDGFNLYLRDTPGFGSQMFEGKLSDDDEQIMFNSLTQSIMDDEINSILLVVNCSSRMDDIFVKLLLNLKATFGNIIEEFVTLVGTRDQDDNYKVDPRIQHMVKNMITVDNQICRTKLSYGQKVFNFSENRNRYELILGLCIDKSITTQIDPKTIHEFRNAINIDIQKVQNMTQNLITLEKNLRILVKEGVLSEIKEYIEIDVSPKKNTVCLNCGLTCHEDCKLSYTISRDKRNSIGCSCIEKDFWWKRTNCKKCGCHHSVHCHTSISTVVNDQFVKQGERKAMYTRTLEEIEKIDAELKKFLKHVIKVRKGNLNSYQMNLLKKAFVEFSTVSSQKELTIEMINLLATKLQI